MRPAGRGEAALADLRLGTGGASSRPWPAVAADLHQLRGQLKPAADYASQGWVLPGLLHDLHQLYVTDPEHRTGGPARADEQL